MSEYQTVAETKVDVLLDVYSGLGWLPDRLSDEWQANAAEKVAWLHQEYGADIVPIAHMPTTNADDARKKLQGAAISGLFPDDVATKLARASDQLRDYASMLVIPQSGLARGAICGVLLRDDEIMTNERRRGIDRMGLIDVVATAAMARRLGCDGAMDILARAYTVDNDMTASTLFGARTVRSPLQKPGAVAFYSQPPRKPQPSNWLARLLAWQ